MWRWWQRCTEAALGTVLGAASPAEGFRRLVTRQGTGTVIAGGSWAGTGRVQHQVHTMEEAGAGAEEGEAAAARAGAHREGIDGKWVQQAGWGGAARGRRQVLVDGQEDVSEKARVMQASAAGKV